MDKVRVWFDREGNYLEVTFQEEKGYFQDTGNDIFMRLNEKGQIIGFAIFNFATREREAIEVPLKISALGSTPHTPR
jgi:uncharacterized protein YuzE